MGVELVGEPVVAYVVGAVAGLGHSAERKVLHRGELRFTLGRVEQAAERLGGSPTRQRGFRVNLVAKSPGEGQQALEFLLIRLAVDTIDEGLGLLERDPVHLAARRHILRDRPVGKEHKLLHQPVGLLGNLLIHIDRTTLRVHLDLHLRTVEVDGPGLARLCLELGREGVESHYGLGKGVTLRDAVRLDICLRPVVGQAAV